MGSMIEWVPVRIATKVTATCEDCRRWLEANRICRELEHERAQMAPETNFTHIRRSTGALKAPKAYQSNNAALLQVTFSQPDPPIP
jgi:hypothetical protein